MPFNDNRQFIAALEKTGDAVRIKEEVDWEEEAGAIARRACEMGAPAPFFEKIKDYPPGYRLFGCPLASHRRLAVALGLPPETPTRTLYAEYQKRIQHPIKPVVVKDGPCKENILTGDDIDLYRFPVPLIHEGDGNRFIGSWHLSITKDPDSDWTNWGVYRVGVHTKNYFVGAWHGATDGGRILFGKYVPKKKPMPVAVAIGADPLCTLAAVAPFGTGESEVDFAGGMRQAPVELVKCHTSDLLVPAHAEIILEGEIQPDAKAINGPFGEFTGYRTEAYMHRVCKLKAITFRNNPILTFSPVGTPVDDSHICQGITYAAVIKKQLLERGVPITDVSVPPECSSHMAVVGVRTLYSTVAHHVKSVMDSRAPEFQHITVVVDADVDVFNLNEVLHTFASRCHPARGIKINDSYLISGLTAYLSKEDRKEFRGASVLFDCTWPPGWDKNTEVPPRSSFNDIYSKGVKEKVLAKWNKYGYK